MAMNPKTKENLENFGYKVAGASTGLGTVGMMAGQAAAYSAGTDFVPAGIAGAAIGAGVGAISAIVHQRQVAKKAQRNRNLSKNQFRG
jgi:hypothetical protein